MPAELVDQAGVDAMMHDLDDSELLDRGPDGVQHSGRRAVAEGGAQVDHRNLVRHTHSRLSRT